MANGLVREENLLARWSFDEGNGSIVNDSVIGGSPLFMNLGKWGNEENGNALSKFSMDISEGTGFAVLEGNRKFQVSSSYSILLWFKTNGLPDDYAQILSKRESTNYSYLFQIKPTNMLKFLFPTVLSHITVGESIIYCLQASKGPNLKGTTKRKM